MFRHLQTLTLRAGLIGLILLASVPEVRCCCDVSWGPAGLFGNRALCAPNSSSQPLPDCCCSHVPEESSPPADGFGGQDCHCRFTVVSPSAMAAGPSADSARAPTLEAWSQASPSTILGMQHVALDLVEQPDSVLMPSQRCALLQTWLV